jgi:GNAT superfamily N-acetyltransferase
MGDTHAQPTARSPITTHRTTRQPTATRPTATRPTMSAVSEPHLDLPPVVRVAGPGDEAEVRRIFQATVLRGRPLPITTGDLDRYTRLCLDWYLEAGEVRVVDAGGAVVGYLLACLDEPAYQRWVRRHAVRWAVGATGEVLVGRRTADARRFVRHRIADGLAGRRAAPPAPAHGHVNLDPGHRGAGIGRQLLRTMDDLVRAAELGSWYGEINLPAGRSLTTVVRANAEVVDRRPSRTFSWLLGRPIERVTIVRHLAPPGPGGGTGSRAGSRSDGATVRERDALALATP